MKCVRVRKISEFVSHQQVGTCSDQSEFWPQRSDLNNGGSVRKSSVTAKYSLKTQSYVFEPMERSVHGRILYAINKVCFQLCRTTLKMLKVK